jgi:hypothetical protein
VYDAIDMLVVLGNTTEFDRLVRCAAGRWTLAPLLQWRIRRWHWRLWQRVEWRSGPSRNPSRAESLAMRSARLCCCASAGRIGVESARERVRFCLLQCARPLLTGGRETFAIVCYATVR